MTVQVELERTEQVPGEQEVHLVSRANYRAGAYVALCGFDCSARNPAPEKTPTCVVCLDLSRGSRQT